MTPAEVDEYRKQLDGVKVRGKNVPKPVKNWNQVGGRVGAGAAMRAGGWVGGVLWCCVALWWRLQLLLCYAANTCMHVRYPVLYKC